MNFLIGVLNYCFFERICEKVKFIICEIEIFVINKFLFSGILWMLFFLYGY